MHTTGSTKLTNAIIITGAGKRIGFALAQHLVKSYPIIISYRTFYPEIEQLQQLGITCLQADFCQLDGIMTFIEQIQTRCHNLKAIIHNASDWVAEPKAILSTDIKNNLQTLEALFNQQFQIHTKLPYLLNFQLSPLLQNYATQTGLTADIIHLTDFVADKGSAKHLAYAASKTALENLTRSFASRFAPYIKVNSIAPALIAFNPQDDQAYRQKALTKSLMQKCGGYQEVCLAVDYLLNSQYVTGESLPINGGRGLK
ncbi:dihydromonapterin reductase [Mergibacter septicus]|uniref:dihydromonapterin reductase n=1 Tax=Mergibacter septicus TaxID=221402 RepID=UPI001178D9E4|nr:dihydromonapterin reductase [Mergibacter septicus]AWX13423.1 dihydromonapterin reductase [Mergibacter septicus]